MIALSREYIRTKIADSPDVYERGRKIYQYGSYLLAHRDLKKKAFTYRVDGNYGNYTTRVVFSGNSLQSSCDCPYPNDGCKHIVAAALNARDILIDQGRQEELFSPRTPEYLSDEEIRRQVLKDREYRAKTETFDLVQGEMYKGDHRVISKEDKEYRVTLHDPLNGTGHCSCMDYLTSGLDTCKHMLFLTVELQRQKGFKDRVKKEVFPFIDIYWNTARSVPALFSERFEEEPDELRQILGEYFDPSGRYREKDAGKILDLVGIVQGNKRVRIRETLIRRIEPEIHARELDRLSNEGVPAPALKAALYPYQEAGVHFGVYKPGVLVGDEMGLGKTLQGIALAMIKKEVFGFSRVVIITLASLKEQWRREIEKFTDETAVIVEGDAEKRRQIYTNDTSFFKITNYEAVLRDVFVLSGYNPDLIILDEAQRIKNFSTKTADAVKQIPKKHGIVLTGTPLENKLEDIYSIIQFLDPYKLTPLWRFACDHFMIPRKKKHAVAGYRNLEMLNDKLRDMVIRRKKEDVLDDLPAEVVNNYYVDLDPSQAKMHAGLARRLAPLLSKKYLTPVDVNRMQMLLLKMRQVCDSTYLVDRETHVSPKLRELEGVIDEVVVQNQRKMVIFTEWTTMTFLIAKKLTDLNIPFVELTGKVPVKKRQALIDEFSSNPQCRIFLSTDAGGTGLNLQAADCVVNFEPPWNPSKLNQRIGRVSRIGQASQCINVINLITTQSIEEKILTSIQLKSDLFQGVFDNGPDIVEFTREKRDAMLTRLREMMGDLSEPAVLDTQPPASVFEKSPVVPDVDSSETDRAHGVFLEQLPEDPIPSDPSEPHTLPVDTDPAATGPVEGQENILANQPPEKIETVLNSGMQFIAGLMEMATGRKIEASKSQEKMISIDRDTGEVTMKFKLPGF